MSMHVMSSVVTTCSVRYAVMLTVPSSSLYLPSVRSTKVYFGKSLG